MANEYIVDPEPIVKEYYSPNIVTVAKTYFANLKLTKTFYHDTVKSTDTPKYFNLFEVEVWDIAEMAKLILLCMGKPRVCFLRYRIKDKHIKVERKYKGPEATLIEQPQNWFAIDVDGYGKCTGNVRNDANSILLALGWQDTECIALASSSYGIKPGIHMRLFFWASRSIENIILKKLLMNNKAKVDLALFNPIQPIYIATPVFLDGIKDPVKNRFAYLQGTNRCINIPDKLTVSTQYSERLYTKKQAIGQLDKAFKIVSEAEHGSRHVILRDTSIWIGKLVAQELLDEEETYEALLFACMTWGDGDRDKDTETIRYGFKVGLEAIDNQEF